VSWFAVDDQFSRHHKVLTLLARDDGLEAVGLWALVGAWCAADTTARYTGRFRQVVVNQFTDDPRLAEHLQRVGLWEPWADPDGEIIGYQFHDWDNWNGVDARSHRSRTQTARRVHVHRLKKCDEGDHSSDCPTTDLDGHAWTCPNRKPKRVTVRNATPGRVGSGRDGKNALREEVSTDFSCAKCGTKHFTEVACPTDSDDDEPP
jgi:hypothetical protein